MQRIAGGEHVGFNNAVFLSEKNTANRNFALTYHMLEKESFPEGYNIQTGTDLYFQVRRSRCETTTNVLSELVFFKI